MKHKAERASGGQGWGMILGWCPPDDSPLLGGDRTGETDTDRPEVGNRNAIARRRRRRRFGRRAEADPRRLKA